MKLKWFQSETLLSPNRKKLRIIRIIICILNIFKDIQQLAKSHFRKSFLKKKSNWNTGEMAQWVQISSLRKLMNDSHQSRFSEKLVTLQCAQSVPFAMPRKSVLRFVAGSIRIESFPSPWARLQQTKAANESNQLINFRPKRKNKWPKKCKFPKLSRDDSLFPPFYLTRQFSPLRFLREFQFEV